MTEWKTYRAEDFCFAVTDGTHDSPKPQLDGRYLITSKHLKPGGIDFSSANKISEADYNKIIQRSKVEQYDILFSMIGTIGNIHRVTTPIVDFVVKNMGIFKMGGDADKSLWMYYWLKSPIAKEYIQSRITGSTQGYLTLGNLRDFPIVVPSLEEQRRIAGILGAIDDKIDNNRRINTNLELQAQALFEEIFFSDNDWEYTTLGMLTEEVKTKVSGMDAKVLSPISSGELVLSEDYFTKQVYSQDTSKYIVVEPKTFAYNPARINIGSIGINSFDFIGCVSPVYVVFKTKSEYENYFRLFVKSDIFKEEVKSRAIGGVRQTLSYRDFAMITTKHPPIESIRAFNDQYNTLLDIINHNNTENRVLATLRDTLLPKLMNGEIKL